MQGAEQNAVNSETATGNARVSRMPSGPPIACGRTAELFAWGEGRVLKLFYDWCPPDWARHEADVVRIVGRTGLPTPKLIGATEVAGRPGLIYERVDGPSMLDSFKTRPWRLSRCARELAGLHAAVHRQSGAGLAQLRADLVRAIEPAKEIAPDLKQEALRILDHLPDGTALCHFDFHPQQVLGSARGWVIVDWITGVQGHPAADVARTLILLNIGQVPGANLFVRRYTNLVKGSFSRTYLSRYFELNPEVTMEQVNTWLVPVATARLRENIAGEREALVKLLRSCGRNPPRQKSGG